MLPSDEVQVTMTREECARIHAALRALIDVQRMVEATGMESAMRLTDAAEVIEGVLPRLAEHFPEGDEDAFAPEYSEPRIEHHAADTKTYGSPATEHLSEFDIKVRDLPDLTPQEASAVFASEYDNAIKALLETLDIHTDFSHDDFHRVLDELKDLMMRTIPMPKNLTVSQSHPYIAVSDLLTLGKLAHEMYLRQDQIDDKITKPF